MTARVTTISTLFLILMLPGFLRAQPPQRRSIPAEVELAHNGDGNGRYQKHHRKQYEKRQKHHRKQYEKHQKHYRKQQERLQRRYRRHHLNRHHHERQPVWQVYVHPRYFPPAGCFRVWNPYRAPRHHAAPVPCGI